ncbi:MAG: hypothetical protein RLZ45_1243 [Verrucomicrobiota bacterium]
MPGSSPQLSRRQEQLHLRLFSSPQIHGCQTHSLVPCSPEDEGLFDELFAEELIERCWIWAGKHPAIGSNQRPSRPAGAAGAAGGADAESPLAEAAGLFVGEGRVLQFAPAEFLQQSDQILGAWFGPRASLSGNRELVTIVQLDADRFLEACFLESAEILEGVDEILNALRSILGFTCRDGRDSVDHPEGLDIGQRELRVSRSEKGRSGYSDHVFGAIDEAATRSTRDDCDGHQPQNSSEPPEPIAGWHLHNSTLRAITRQDMVELIRCDLEAIAACRIRREERNGPGLGDEDDPCGGIEFERGAATARGTVMVIAAGIGAVFQGRAGDPGDRALGESVAEQLTPDPQVNGVGFRLPTVQLVGWAESKKDGQEKEPKESHQPPRRSTGEADPGRRYFGDSRHMLVSRSTPLKRRRRLVEPGCVDREPTRAGDESGSVKSRAPNQRHRR